jgi:hypothetical protein
MLKSLQTEDYQKSLNESFLHPDYPKVNRIPIEEQIKRQNTVITIILGCLIVGAILLLCIVIL